MTRDELLRALLVERFAPSPRRLPCNKIPFPSEQVARNYGRLLELRYRDGVKRDAYECDRCEPGTWHVTRNGSVA